MKLTTHTGRRFLVIARVGDESTHRLWLGSGSSRNFDLFLNYYGDMPNRYADDADYYFESKGTKYPALKHLIEQMGKRIHKYDAVWFPDDDISSDAYTIGKMFELFKQEGFLLAQPALTNDSFASHAITMQNFSYRWRYTQFVEVMAPIFSIPALSACLHTFDQSISGYGLDFVWPKILGYPHKKIAIIDETPVKHTRAVGSRYKDLYRQVNYVETPMKELFRLTKQYQIPVSFDFTHYDGVIQGKRILFALLVHKDEHVVAEQIKNIRHFNPNAGIILYNGSQNQGFGKSLGVPICPYSRPLKWGFLVQYLWDIMKWLEEIKLQYDYLVNMDHDILFIKHGYEAHLDSAMRDADCMGIALKYSRNPKDHPFNREIVSLWNNWHVWQPFFRTSTIVRYFNPMQVYRREIVRSMLAYNSKGKAERLFEESQVFAMEETFFVTLASALGGRIREYSKDGLYRELITWGKVIKKRSIVKALRNPYYYFIHPVKGNRLIEINRWLQRGAPLRPLSGHKKKKRKLRIRKKQVTRRKKRTTLGSRARMNKRKRSGHVHKRKMRRVIKRGRLRKAIRRRGKQRRTRLRKTARR